MRFAIALILSAGALYGDDVNPNGLAAKALQEIRDHDNNGQKNLQRALHEWQSQPGGPPPEFAVPATVMAAILEGRRKFGEEDKLLEQIDSIYRIDKPADGPDLAVFLELQSASLARRGDEVGAKQTKARASAIRSRLVDALFGNASLPAMSEPDAPPPPLKMNSLERKPRLIYKVDPDYSEIARLARISGKTVVSLVVEPNGLPSTIHVVSSLGFGLDENGARAANLWRFQPGIKDGRPVRVHAVIEMNFQLR